VEVATDGTVKARVRFTDPAGVPLERDGMQTPGVISSSAILTYIPKGQTQYVAYTTRRQTSTITGEVAVQAGADSGGVWARVGEGEYTYTFATKLPVNYEKGSTHTIGIYGARNLEEFELGRSLADTVYHWVPDNSTKAEPRDVIKTQSCKKCHVDNFAFHGATGRVSMEVCVLCHSPQTTDPDTGNTVDMATMIHKIHRGADLPSVVAGGSYQIIGNGNSVHDYSEVTIPTDVRNCTVCHEQNTGAAQARNHLTKPSRASCGGCHDNVNFATGENHVNLPQISDNQCSQCHTPQGEQEFDASITGAHTLPYNSKQLSGFKYEILKVDDGVAGRKPTVTYSIKDKNENPLKPSDFGRLSAVMGGPTTDYNTRFPGIATPGYVSEDMLTRSTGADGVYTYTFTNALPAEAKGTFSIGLEGRRVEIIYPGTKIQRSVQYNSSTNAVSYFSVDSSPVQERRKVVAIEKCQACHVSIRLHGENRVDNIEHCVTCHNPMETDVSRRPASAGAAASVDFRQMIHNIHGGHEIQSAYKTEDYVIYGYGASLNNFSHVKYPGRLASCDACHVNNSQQLPLPATNARVMNPRGPVSPMMPQSASCLSCHRSNAAASHAMANTTSIGESCSTCHGPNGEFSVRKVHAAASLPVPRD
jgi:OmcA/MtrC family decaheme c-type cytochrome